MPFRCVRVRAVLPADTTALPTSFRPYAPPQAGSRGFLVEIDTMIRRISGAKKLEGNELWLQQLTWMADANRSAFAEFNAIILSSIAFVLLEASSIRGICCAVI